MPEEMDSLEGYSSTFPKWWIYRGTGHTAPAGKWDSRWPKAPPARQPRGTTRREAPEFDNVETQRRFGCRTFAGYRDRGLLNGINVAIALARPLLVTGAPGTGKSAIAYAIASELGLGRVLRWSLTPTDTLRSGLYEYDMVGHVNASRTGQNGSVSEFVRLGPVGTAFLGYRRPRVLLLDAIDQTDFDFTCHLLTLVEDGCFEIPELVRDAQPEAVVFTADPGVRASVVNGIVTCDAFPLVIITSNGDRDLPSSFRRRCVEVSLRPPTTEELRVIVDAHFPEQQHPFVDELVHLFAERRAGDGAPDVEQLLHAIHLFSVNEEMMSDPEQRDEILGLLWRGPADREHL
ncbi:AAA family ATPase [Amycolatopsis sp. NPDC005003]